MTQSYRHAGCVPTEDRGTRVLAAFSISATIFGRVRLKRSLIFTLAGLPWVLLHHVLNYAIASTIGPGKCSTRILQLAWSTLPSRQHYR